jgi:hypothetical protein
MKKQPELTAQTKENLMEAFWQIYCQKRIEKVTVKEITAKAGYNRSTFYEYFTDVYDVLKQIENSLLPSLPDLPPLNLASVSIPPMPISAFPKMYEKNRKYYVVLFGDNGDPSFQSKIKNHMKAMLKKTLGEQGIGDSFEMDITLEYTLSAMIGVMTYWFKMDTIADGKKLFELMDRLARYGIMRVFSGQGEGEHKA